MKLKKSSGLRNTSPEVVAVNIVNVILGFLALIMTVLVLYGGFTWMTAGGNSEKADTARNILSRAFIGLLIVAAAWGIVQWLVGEIEPVTQQDEATSIVDDL